MANLQGYVGLQRRLHAVENASKSGLLLRKLADAAIAEQKARTPVKTANLKRSIHVGAVTPTVAATVASANYARYVEFGTKPHEIRPRKARVLAWPASAAGRRLTGTARSAMRKGGAATLGGWAFAAVVHHPGTRAHPFMVPGAKAAIAASPWRDTVVAAWNEAA